uniref:RNA-directed DNA polymerase n=1 Tax=Heliothis virescens TaxID=7102 RepID=A0A2A4J5K1_HELVI
MGRLAAKLESLVDQQIIEKVEQPDSFVSNLVIIEKVDKTLRICLDPKELNKVLIRNYHLIPTLEEILAKLNNKSIFSVLDLSDGFYNIKLTEQSKKLCTFSSPFGCYRFLRLPFGLSIAPEIFQKYSENTFGDIPGVVIYCDDLLICADNEEEHDKILIQVLERARKCNVRFNKRKFQFKLTEVKYFGHIFSKNGMKIDPDRIKAIVELKSPKNKKELQIILGMINYLRRFVSSLAEIAAPLQVLLKNDVEWLWTHVHEKTLNDLKLAISQAPVLQNFNSNLPITIQCDASKDGLGCCLMQDGKPVSYASRSLTSAEKNFSQIEKELLSVVWSTKKFHYYIYGRKCIILNDHKPLETLLKKGIHEIPSPRLQRLKLKLLKYDIEFKYLKGKLMHVADLLSRSFLEETDNEDNYMYEVVHCVGLDSYLQCSDDQKQELISETLKDEELVQLCDSVKYGWPDKINKVPDSIKYYFRFREEITVDNNLLFKNDRLIIPKSIRLSIIKQLHEGHLGCTKMKQTARKCYYWPNMDLHIEEFVKKCFVCQTYQNNNVKEPLLSHTIPDLPFTKIGIDIMEFKKKNYLVIFDYFTKWLDIKFIPSKSASNIISSLIDIFSHFGIPAEIVSDHVPFDSRECKNFAAEWGIKFNYSSPRYPQSNGMAERGVQIAKKILTKCNEDKSDYRIALLQYRSAPVSGTPFSPAQLMMSRNLKTKLPVTQEYLKPRMNINVKEEFNKSKNRNEKYYNQNVRSKESFLIGQEVWFKKDPNSNKWLEGKIVGRNKFRSYEILDIKEGCIYTRTSYHLQAR